jgi:hypothetical protein
VEIFLSSHPETQDVDGFMLFFEFGGPPEGYHLYIPDLHRGLLRIAPSDGNTHTGLPRGSLQNSNIEDKTKSEIGY